ncbi:MAG: hypothetical protein ABH803_00140 [Candidatus Micrarchaeota archaeon]
MMVLLNSIKRGQVFSGDLILSVILFLLALSLLNVVWQESSARVKEFDAKTELFIDAGLASDYLLETKGLPIDWSKDTVTSLGLSDGVSLNPVKFLELTLVDYDYSRELLGLGDYDYRVYVTNGSSSMLSGVLVEPVAYFAVGDAKILQDLSSSGVNWDFYDSAGAGSGYSQLNYFSGSPNELTAALFSSVFNYSTLILENVNTSVNFSLLDDFLESGGSIVFEGGNSLDANWISHYYPIEEVDASSSEIVRKDFLIFNASVGDSVSLPGLSWVVNADGVFTPVVSVSGDSLKAVAGYSRVSNGWIFFVSDYSMNASKQSRDFFNLIGKRLSFESTVLVNEDVFVINRPVLVGVGRKKLGVFELVVGRK